MGNVGVIAVVVLLVTLAVFVVLRNSKGLVARRGLSIGADLAGMADAPRVRIRAVTQAGPDRVRLILMPDEAPAEDAGPPGSADLDLLVRLEESDFGFGLLRAWQRSESPLALVLPPGSRLVRLRSVDDLQHLALRRIDEPCQAVTTAATEPRSDVSDFNSQIIQEFRSHHGQVGGPFQGAPILVLTTTGAKSGQPRTHPLVYLADGDRLVVFASKAGAPTNPDWYHNLKAHPRVKVEVGDETFEADATVAEGTEHERLYAAQAAVMPGFAEYQAKTDRVIPVVVLTRS